MNYLENRSQFTIVNGEHSNTERVNCGVPQGSLYGPRLFSIFSNDLPDQQDFGETEMFADDTTPYCIADTYDNSFLILKDLITQTENWAVKNRIHIHPEKSSIMFLSRITFVGPYPRFTLKYHDVQIVQSMKCLGIKIDNKLNWSSHISYVSKNFIAKFKKLYELRSCQTHHLKSIYLKGVLPTVLYCIAIWGSCNDNMMQSLEKIHIRAARFICRLKKNIPNSDVLEKCKWKPLSYYYKKRLACIAHSIYYESAPRPLLDIMVKKHNTRNTRNNIAFGIPKFKTLNYKHHIPIQSHCVCILQSGYQSLKQWPELRPVVA